MTTMNRRFALLLLLLLAGCSSSRPLPVAEGPLFQLNPKQWAASPADLTPPEETR